MVNPYTDPRYVMARLMRQQAAPERIPGDTFKPQSPMSPAAIQLGRAANNAALNNPSLRQQIEAIRSGESSGGGNRGLVGTVLGNPIAKVGFNALGVLAIPGRATIAAIREGVDAYDGDPNTRASFSDFKKNVQDNQFGFGKAFKIDTGSKWLDRAIGFAGDVFLDPLTYATFGAGKFAGYGGRLDLANQVLKVTNDAGLAGRVARFGRSAPGMSSEILEMAGANRYGLHFLGKRIKVGQKKTGMRLPTSGAIGYAGEYALSRLRVSAMNTKAGQLLQKVTMPGDFLTARQALAAGKTSDGAAGALVTFFNADPIQRMEAGRVLQTERDRLATLFETEKTSNLDGYKNSLSDLLENDELFNAAPPELQRAAQVYKNVFNEYEDNLLQAIKEVDQTIDPSARFRANYFPRIVSEDGLRVLSDPSHPFGSSLRTIFQRDPMNGGRNFRARMMEEKDIFFGHKLTTEDLASTSKLNEIAREGGFKGNFFETDITKVLDSYVDEYAKEMGVLAKHKHLVDNGFWKRVEEVEVSGPFIDQELVDGLKKRVKSLDDDLAKSAKSTATALRSLEGAIKEAKGTLKKQIGEAGKSLKNLESFDGVARTADQILREGIDLSDAGLQQAIDQLGTFRKQFADFLGVKLTRGGKIVPGEGVLDSDVPVIAESILGMISKTEAAVVLAKQNLELANSGAVGKELEELASNIQKEMQNLDVEINRTRNNAKQIIEYGNILNDNLEKVIAGDISGLADNQLKDIGLLLSPGSGSETVQKVIQERLGIIGDTQPWLRDWMNTPNGTFVNLTRLTDTLKPDEINKMQPGELQDIMARVLDSKANPDELRKAAFYMLGMDERAYMGVLPEALISMRTQLEASLLDMDEALAYSRSMERKAARNERSTAEKIFETQVKDAYIRVVDSIEQLSSVSRFQNEEIFITLKNAVEENPALRDTVDAINFDRMSPYFEKYPFLREFFESNNTPQVSFKSPFGDSVETRDLDIDKVRELMNEDAFVYKPSEQVAEILSSRTYTVGEFLDEIDSLIKTKNGILDEPAYEFGSGASTKAWTGRELKARVEEYRTLKEELANVRLFKSKVEEELYTASRVPELREQLSTLKNMGAKNNDPRVKGLEALINREKRGTDLEDELAKLKKKKVRDDDPRVVSLQKRINAFKSEAKTRASIVEYDDTLILELRKAGYFNANTVDESARIRADVESNYVSSIKSARGGKSIKTDVDGKKKVIQSRSGTFSIGDIETEIRQKIAGISGGDGLLRPEAFDNLPNVQKRFAETALNYSIVSEVHGRFAAVSSSLAPFNQAPTERMVRGILQVVAQKHIPRVQAKVNAHRQTQFILRQMDQEVSQSIRSGVRPSQAFDEALRGLKDSERVLLQETVGSQMAWTADPMDLKNRISSARKNKNTSSPGPVLDSEGNPKLDVNGKPLKMDSEAIIAENKVYQEFVEPWFRAAYPNDKYSKKAAKDRIAQLTAGKAKKDRSSLSPFSEQATSTAIRRWFESIIGVSDIPGRSFRKPGITSIELEIRSLKSQQSRLRSFLAPDLNMGLWMDDPSTVQRTATWYAYLMDSAAERLDEAIGLHGKEIDRVNAGLADSAANKTKAAAIDVEIDRIMNSVDDIPRLREEVDMLEKEIKLIGPKTPNEAVLVSAKRSDRQTKLAAAKKQLAEANTLPKRLQTMVNNARERNKLFFEAEGVVKGIQLQIKTIDDRIVKVSESKSPAGIKSRRIKELEAQKKKLETPLKKAKEKQRSVDVRSSKERELLLKADKDDALEQMSKANQEYAELTSSAEYVKAVADREMHDALVLLSEYNLSDFSEGFRVADTFEEGARGLPDRSARFVLMPDGSRLLFTPGEAASLYRSDLSPYELGRARSALRNEQETLELMLETMQRRISGVDSQLEARLGFEENLQKEIVQIENFNSNPRALGEIVGSYEARKTEAAKRLNAIRAKLSESEETTRDVLSMKSEIRAEIKRLENQLGSVRSEYQSLLNEVQSSALAKMRILVEGTTVKSTGERIPPVFGPDGVQAWSRGVRPIGTPDTTISSAEFMAREYNLNSAWIRSGRGEVLDRAQKLRNDVFVQSVIGMRNDVDSVNLADLKLKYLIEKRVANADKTLDDVIDTRVAAIREAREAERITGEPISVSLYGDVADNPLAQGDPAFVTSETIREFANSVREQNIPTGPFVERMTKEQAKSINTQIKNSYDRKIAQAKKNLNNALDAQKSGENVSKRSIAIFRNKVKTLEEQRAQALASGRSPAQLEATAKQKEAAKNRRTEQYNAAVQSVEEWKKKNPSVIKEAEKNLREQKALLDNLNVFRRELQRADKKVVDKMDRTYGGTEGYWKQVEDTKALIDNLNEQLRLVDSITAMPNTEARAIIMRLTSKKGGVATQRADGAIAAYKEWMEVNKEVFEQLASNPEDPIVRALSNAATAEAEFIWNSYNKFDAIEALMDADVEVWTTRIVQPLADEWQKAAKKSGLYPDMTPGGKRAVDRKTGADISKGFPGLMGNTEAQELLNRMSMINTPGVVNDLSKFMRGYTGFFRGYATLSPGFHVRNSISNTFALFAAGAEIGNMTRGFAVWKQIQSGIKSGRSIDEILDTMPSDQKDMARIAYKVMVGLGGGRTADALEGFARSGNKITDNAFLRTSRNVGNTTESAARFMLAYDSAVKGMDEVASFNRTGRFLVDYNKKTVLDETMRDIMPFWVWMSRNLPLQVVTRWTNPKPYLVWDKISKNLESREEGEVVPEYLRELGAIGLGGGRFLSLDLPFSRVDEQIQGFSNPKEFLSYLNPGIKAPIEFLTNTDTFRDRKFPDTYRKVDGVLLPFAPLLQALGQIQYDSNGNMVTSERAYTTLSNLIPPLGRAERLFPADASFNSQASRGFLGIPYTEVSEGSREAELYRRLAEVQRVGGLDKKINEAR